MKISKKIKVILLICSLILVLAAGVSIALAKMGHFKLLADTLQIYPKSGTIQVTVLDKNNNPYPGVNVGIASWSGFGYNLGPTKTGKYGKATFSGAPFNPDLFVAAYTDIGAFNCNRAVRFSLSPSSPVFQTTIKMDCGTATPPNQSKTFTVTGFVKVNYSDFVKQNNPNTPINGASVNISGKTATTKADGSFTISNIPIIDSSPSSYTLNVLKTGYYPISNSTLASYLVGQTIIANSVYGIAVIYLSPQTSRVPFDNTTFVLRGKTLNADNEALMAGITVTVSCVNPCAMTPKTAASGSKLFTSPEGYQYNYEVRGIYNINQPLSDIQKLKIEYTTTTGFVLFQFDLPNPDQGAFDLPYKWRSYFPERGYSAGPPPYVPIIVKNDSKNEWTYRSIYTNANENINVAYEDVLMYDTIKTNK